MKYSNYSLSQVTFPIYEEVAQKLLSLAKDGDTIRKMKRHII